MATKKVVKISLKYIFYTLALMFIFLGVVLHQSDISEWKSSDGVVTIKSQERNIFNYTENTFIWNSSKFQTENLNNTNISMEDAFVFRFENILNKAVDLVGYTAFAVIKLGMEFGYEKAYNYQPEDFIWIIKLIFIIAILSFIIPMIVPALALAYLLFESFKWLIKYIKKKKWD